MAGFLVIGRANAFGLRYEEKEPLQHYHMSQELHSNKHETQDMVMQRGWENLLALEGSVT